MNLHENKGTQRLKNNLTAEGFRKVDLYMVRDGAILSKKAGISQFSLLTSKGSNSNIWSNDWKISHPLLYFKVKGDAEQAVIKQKFKRTSIFRPGYLARDGDTGGLMTKLDVRDLAAIIIYDAEGDEITVGGDEKMVDEPMEKIEDKAEAEKDEKADDKEEDKDGGDDGDKEKVEVKKEDKGDVKVEDEKKDGDKGGDVKVEDVLIYEGGDIECMVLLARENFNAVCGEKVSETKGKKKKVDVKVEKKEEVKVEEVVKEEEKPKEDKVDEEEKPKEEVRDEVKEEPKDEEPKKEENVEEVGNDEITPKYEVVEKPDENEQDKEVENVKSEEDVGKDDYVEVDKADASKENVNDGDQ